jgi:hypothetical protein
VTVQKTYFDLSATTTTIYDQFKAAYQALGYSGTALEDQLNSIFKEVTV